MQKIKMMFEYHCFPIWVYDEKGELLCNDLPHFLQKDESLTEACQRLQTQYDSLFIDDGKEFAFVGDDSAKQRDDFLKEAAALYDELVRRCGDGVEVVRAEP